MNHPVERGIMKFTQVQKKIRPGSRKIANANPFRPTTLKMIEEWIEQQTLDSFVKAELMKMVRQVPNGALDHFRANINTNITVANERVRQSEG
jgi:hypothetical protein